MWEAKNKRINGYGNEVYDLYRESGRFFIATVEVRDDASGGMKVLLGAMQPAGKVRALEAIRFARLADECHGLRPRRQPHRSLAPHSEDGR